MAAFRVGVIDDNPTFLQQFASYIDSKEDIEVVFASPDGEGLIELVERTAPDLLIMDLSSSQQRGALLSQALLQANIPTPVLIFSAFIYPRLTQALQRWKNVVGYLVKSEYPEEVVAAIRRIAAGERGLLSQEIIDALAAVEQPEPPLDPSLDELLGAPYL